MTEINASDTSVLLTLAKAAAFEAAVILVSAPTGDSVMLSDTAVHLEGLTVSQIDGLTAIGVAGIAVSSARILRSASPRRRRWKPTALRSPLLPVTPSPFRIAPPISPRYRLRKSPGSWRLASAASPSRTAPISH